MSKTLNAKGRPRLQYLCRGSRPAPVNQFRSIQPFLVQPLCHQFSHFHIVQVGHREMRVAVQACFGLSSSERQILVGCMENIREELQSPVFDKHSKSLIVDNIKLLLDYCIRFYDRQFITRENLNSDILARFETLLYDYFHSERPATEGLPTVQYCADKLCLSANYLSDLLRWETGMSALKHIQQQTLETAKERVFNTQKSISEIAYELGFTYPQHFSRWFKKQTGCTPNEYREQA